MEVINHNTGRKLIPIVVLTVVLLIGQSFLLNTFNRKQINTDAIEYYSFVTAVFECGDLSFTSDCPKIYFANTTPDGKKVNKRSVGMAIMYLPWYGFSQLHASMLGRYDDGYTKRTEAWLVIGIWCYIILGIYFLGLALAKFFPISQVRMLLLLMLTGTNLIWYTNGEVLFTHAVNFMWVSLLIYYTIQYHHIQKQFYIICIGLAIGMLTIIRPNNLILAGIPILYNIYDKESLLRKLNLLKTHWSHLLLAISILFLISVPQLLYWKYSTDKWIYYSYQGEFFYWSKPRIFEFLFSFRKGWLIYTPIMIFSVIGIMKLNKAIKSFRWLLFVLVPLFVYVSSCWWSWSYGGCYGMRPMIDLYPLLAFPLMILVDFRKWYRIVVSVPIIIILVGLNYFQAWQYSKGILHYDQMNFAVYKSIWMKTKYPLDYDLLVSYPDYLKEAKGEGPYYSAADITENAVQLKYIRSGFLQMDTIDYKMNSMASNFHPSGLIQFVHDHESNAYLLKQVNSGVFLCINKDNSMLYPCTSDIIQAERFQLIFIGQNKFALQAANEYYISSSEGNGNNLKADALEINPTSIFTLRIYRP